MSNGSGILCPACGSTMGVSDSRGGMGYIRRRRKCDNAACATKITTVETMADADRMRQALDLRAQLEALPTARREIVVRLIAEFTALEK